MKHSGEEKTRRDRGRRARKRANPLPQPAIPEPVELPEPPVLPDVYTKDRRSIHPTRKATAKTLLQEKRHGERQRLMLPQLPAAKAMRLSPTRSILYIDFLGKHVV